MNPIHYPPTFVSLTREQTRYSTEMWWRTHVRDHTTSFNNTYPLFHYEPQNSKGEPVELRIGNIVINSMEETHRDYYTYGLSFNLKDDHGNTRTRYFGGASFYESVKIAFEILRNHQGSNLHELELSEANGKLTEENKKLTERLEELEDELQALREQLEAGEEADQDNPSE